MKIDLTEAEVSLLLDALDLAIETANEESAGDEDGPEARKCDDLERLEQKLRSVEHA